MGSAAVLVTLPAGVALGSWLAARLGARSALLLLFPFPVLVHHLGVHAEGGLAATQASVRASLASVPMVFSWAVPYAALAGRLRGRWAPALAMGGATAVAVALQRLWAPWVAAIEADAAAVSALALVVAGLGGALLRVPADEAPLPATVSPASFGARLGSIVAVLLAVALLGSRTGPVAAAAVAVLTAFPRMTMELTVATHVSDGPRAARQVLAGLAPGLGAALAWCLAALWLPPLVGGEGALFAGGLGAVAVTGGLARAYVRRWRAPAAATA